MCCNDRTSLGLVAASAHYEAEGIEMRFERRGGALRGWGELLDPSRGVVMIVVGMLNTSCPVRLFRCEV